MEKYTDKYGVKCYRGATPETPFDDLEFQAGPTQKVDRGWILRTDMGILTVVDRKTGYSRSRRDVETGYRDPDGNFWLASGRKDVRHSGAKTLQDAIDWVKANANTCIGTSGIP